jgi:hypothetical protein
MPHAISRRDRTDDIVAKTAAEAVEMFEKFAGEPLWNAHPSR